MQRFGVIYNNTKTPLWSKRLWSAGKQLRGSFFRIFYMITTYHAKYYANLLTQKAVGGELATISQSLLSSSVDINPHQIDAALFAFKSPLSKGVVLADEVGLGKTIEAGLVVCQYWAMGKRKILIVCPASLRKQWSAELQINSALIISSLIPKTITKPYVMAAAHLYMERQLFAHTILWLVAKQRYW